MIHYLRNKVLGAQMMKKSMQKIKFTAWGCITALTLFYCF